jgi:hypothetical protein
MHRYPVAQFLNGVQERADLVEASDREVAVVLPGERAEQRDTFEAKQICQRMLVDHLGGDPLRPRWTCSGRRAH